jgi:hypothetical protein
MAKKITRNRPWTNEEVRMLKSLAREKTKTTVIARKLKRKRGCGVSAGIKAGRHAGSRSKEERDMVSKREAVRQDESSSESCLHCEINDLVQEHVEGQDNVDIAELAARMAESLVDLILLAPDEERANLLATTVAHLGHAFLEKSGVIEGDSATAH